MRFRIPCRSRPDLSPAKQTLPCLKVLLGTAWESWLRISLFQRNPRKLGYFSAIPQNPDSSLSKKKPPPRIGKAFSSVLCIAATTHNSPSMTMNCFSHLASLRLRQMTCVSFLAGTSPMRVTRGLSNGVSGENLFLSNIIFHQLTP